MFVTGVSKRVDELCGPVVRRQVTDERHDGGKARVFTDLEHAVSVQSVSEWSGGVETVLEEETLSTLPAAGFLLDSKGAYSFIWRRQAGSDCRFVVGRRNVVVAYRAGRYESTTVVGEVFKTAAGSVLRRLWKREQDSWAHSPALPTDNEDPQTTMRFFKAVDPMIKELLADELLPPVGL
jgi:hypothetical protein